jgi:hypothetical protein
MEYQELVANLIFRPHDKDIDDETEPSVLPVIKLQVPGGPDKHDEITRFH